MGLYLLAMLLAACTILPLVASDFQGVALCELKSSLNATSNQLQDWLPFFYSPCDWSHVDCDGNNNVFSITLPRMGFSGFLSPKIGVLKYLSAIDLEENNITGEIPTEFGNLSRLVNLNLRNNRLTGTIPSSLGNLTMLKYLDLSLNRLNGSIPESIANLPSLKDLELTSNGLSGHIPARLFQISNYNYSGNNLSCGQNFPHSCASEPSNARRSSHKPTLGTISGIVGAIVFLLGGAMYILWKHIKNKAVAREVSVDAAGEVLDQEIAFGQLKRFSWSELQQATDNFNRRNALGKGGTANVYKGVLVDHTRVAIKRLLGHRKSDVGETFVCEAQMISFAVHRHIIRLIGYCTTASELLLVYPYMENGSVDNRIRGIKDGKPALDWPCRKRVALGTARGLEYLHEQCTPEIVHRDIKASNVLLDENFEPVIGDFGFAKLLAVRGTNVTTNIRGTWGYMDPVYITTRKLSSSNDVFAFGVLLLELVTGQRAVDFSREGEDNDELLFKHFSSTKMKKLRAENRLLDVVDPNLSGSYNKKEVGKMIEVALLCTQPPDKRPRMSEVLKILEGIGDHSHLESQPSQRYKDLFKYFG